MRPVALFLLALFSLTAQTPSVSPAPGSVLHLVYQWGFNTGAAKPGPGTGTTSIDIMGPANDGGVMIQGTDWIWNTTRARQTSVCELYPNGRINCAQAPYGLSPIQLTIFPLLGQEVFQKLGSSGTGTWQQSYKVRAAVLPAAQGQPFLSNPYTWDFVYTFTGKGPIADASGTTLVTSMGTFAQEGGYFRGSGTQKIAYDPLAKIPVAISDVRTHVPQRNTSNDSVEVKLLSATVPHQ